MSARELTVRYIEFMTRDDMCRDTTELLNEALLIHGIILTKSIDDITDMIIEPLYKEYEECDKKVYRDDIIEITRDLLNYVKGK